MRIMGIDYGDKRIGIAMSDPMGWTAQGIETVLNGGNPGLSALKRIAAIAFEYKAETIVVGYPRNMNGSSGGRAEKTDIFINRLEKIIFETYAGVKPAVMVKWDERLSSVAANRTMTEIGVRTSRKKGIVDQIAAAHILQGYLDNIRIKNAGGEKA
ncbi:MAG: Holliday junction resolvase RuvX [Eubacteriales bacterium]|nr:Holliday junction resolvase RuvX [Eubacteriales bacterium]